MTSDTRIVVPQSGSHFYLPDGTPFYSVPNKSKPGQMRAANVTDAKAAGALPSVTTILGMVHRYALAAWVESQYILAGARTVRLEGEDDDAFCRRIRDEGRAEAIAAAEFGTRVHDEIAFVQRFLVTELGLDSLASSGIEINTELLPFISGWCEWARANECVVYRAEQCFADVDERYGGRIDCVGTLRGEPVVIDWQTSSKMVTYPEKYAQVVAYKRGGRLEGRPLIVTISSTTPGLIEEHEVEDEAASWQVFADARSLYYGLAGPWKSAS